ncbi:MAG: RNA methyltransferase [Hyphomicrobiales bacterium]
MSRKLKNNELGRIDIEEYKTSEKMPVILVLDNIRSLNNIGSMFRTSDGFRLEAVYLCGITAKPPHRDIQKTALGATDSVNWKYFDSTMDAIKQLKEDEFIIASIEQVENSVMLHDFKPEKDKKYALVVGNEVKGVEQEVVTASDVCLEIPQFGTKHSFNVTISAGIVLWDICSKLNFSDIK